jgi:hypothetical protein
MSRPIIKVHNIETDTIEERPMNDAEFEQYQEVVLAAQKQQDLEAKRLVAEAKLAALGLDADDLKALGL